MGYYTRYSLVWNVHDQSRVKTCEHQDELIEGANFCHICGRTTDLRIYLSRENLLDIAKSFDEGLARVLDFIWEGETTKWYEHDGDMKALSERVPGVLFTMTGAGEEPGDMWTKYYYEGKVQEASKVEVTVNDFDAEALS
jgi:hypothetical protein